MDNKTKRLLLFLLGCIPVRLFFVFLAYKFPKILPILGYLALIPATGFLLIFLTGSRKTGPEVFGGKIWWNWLRPIHSLLYFTFAYLAINKVHKYAWRVLLLDVLIGLVSFLVNFKLYVWN